jgi:hypothetical protein
MLWGLKYVDVDDRWWVDLILQGEPPEVRQVAVGSRMFLGGFEAGRGRVLAAVARWQSPPHPGRCRGAGSCLLPWDSWPSCFGDAPRPSIPPRPLARSGSVRSKSLPVQLLRGSRHVDRRNEGAPRLSPVRRRDCQSRFYGRMMPPTALASDLPVSCPRIQ